MLIINVKEIVIYLYEMIKWNTNENFFLIFSYKDEKFLIFNDVVKRMNNHSDAE